MFPSHFAEDSRRVRRTGVRMLPVAALALLFIMALPSRAESRAIKSRVPPVYPEIAKRMRIGGTVKLEATVDATGRVKDVKALSGSRMLDAAAEDAVRRWTFEPGAGDSNVEVQVNFEVNQ